MGWLFNPFAPCCGPPPPCGTACVNVLGCCNAAVADAAVSLRGPSPSTALVGTASGPVACIGLPRAGSYAGRVVAPGYPDKDFTVDDFSCVDVSRTIHLDYDIPDAGTLIDPAGNAIPMTRFFSSQQYSGQHTYADPGECILVSGSCFTPSYHGSATIYYGYDHCAKALFVLYWLAQRFVGGYYDDGFRYSMIDDSLLPPPVPGGFCVGYVPACTSSDQAAPAITGNRTTDSWDCLGFTWSGDIDPTALACSGHMADALTCVLGGTHFSFAPA
jgi:hypothetical protein